MKRTILFFVLMLPLFMAAQQFPKPFLTMQAQGVRYNADTRRDWNLAWGYAGIKYQGNWNYMTYELNKQAIAILKVKAFRDAPDYDDYLMRQAYNKFSYQRSDGSVCGENYRRIAKWYKRKHKHHKP